MAISNYLEDALINATLRNVPFTVPTNVYVALFTSNPTDAGVGTEVTGGSYARQAGTFAAPVNGTTSNSAEIVFPIATADWGTITHIGIYDAVTNGNLLYHAQLDASKAIVTSTQLRFPPEYIVVTIS